MCLLNAKHCSKHSIYSSQVDTISHILEMMKGNDYQPLIKKLYPELYGIPDRPALVFMLTHHKILLLLFCNYLWETLAEAAESHFSSRIGSPVTGLTIMYLKFKSNKESNCDLYRVVLTLPYLAFCIEEGSCHSLMNNGIQALR